MIDYSEQLLDFMYVDKSKTSSLLAQILSEGLVTETVETNSEAVNSKTNLGISSKVLGMLGASAEHERKSAVDFTETVSKNPEWAQAKALVQYIADHDQQTDYGTLDIGHVRLLTGSLSIYDLSPFRQLADNPRLLDASKSLVKRFPHSLMKNVKEIEQQIAIKTNMLDNGSSKNIRSELKTLKADRDQAIAPFEDMVDLGIEAISHFVRYAPFSLISVLKVDGESYWFSLKQNALLHDHGDTLLKYGHQIEGKWSVACIVDGVGAQHKTDAQDLSDNAEPDIIWKQMVEPFADLGRQFAGRPDTYKSLMPLVVFRPMGRLLR